MKLLLEPLVMAVALFFETLELRMCVLDLEIGDL